MSYLYLVICLLNCNHHHLCFPSPICLSTPTAICTSFQLLGYRQKWCVNTSLLFRYDLFCSSYTSSHVDAINLANQNNALADYIFFQLLDLNLPIETPSALESRPSPDPSSSSSSCPSPSPVRFTSKQKRKSVKLNRKNFEILRARLDDGPTDLDTEEEEGSNVEDEQEPGPSRPITPPIIESPSVSSESEEDQEPHLSRPSTPSIVESSSDSPAPVIDQASAGKDEDPMPTGWVSRTDDRRCYSCQLSRFPYCITHPNAEKVLLTYVEKIFDNKLFTACRPVFSAYVCCSWQWAPFCKLPELVPLGHLFLPGDYQKHHNLLPIDTNPTSPEKPDSSQLPKNYYKSTVRVSLIFLYFSLFISHFSLLYLCRYLICLLCLITFWLDKFHHSSFDSNQASLINTANAQ